MKIRKMLGISNAKLIFGSLDSEVDFGNFSKDSRTTKEGDVFLGIKGDNFDGNDYWEEAFKKGATTCILTKNIKASNNYPDRNLVIVDDMQEFLMELAKPICDELKVPVIAVTGSVGKTSTKNIIADILSLKYKVLKTSGNLNTLIGLALTILKLKDEDIAVIEMGMNHAGEISKLTNFIKPDLAVITNVGTAHIGLLGSRENILKAKLEILEGLKGPILINNDNDLLNVWQKEANIKNKIITYGIDSKSEYEAKDLNYDKKGSHFKINNQQVDINVLGKHFIYNALAAFAIGKIYNVDEKEMIKKLREIPLESNRMELINQKSLTIINDTYNSSYDSVYYALEVLSFFPGRKIAVLGSIGELGDYSEEIHRKIGLLILKNNIDILITAGDASQYINKESLENGFNKNNSYHFTTKKEAIDLINSIKQVGDTFLVKASNSQNFIEIVENILK